MVFTGLVTGIGEGEFQERKEGSCLRITIKCKGWFKDVALGDSIAVNGVCLTVVEFDDDQASFDVMAETLRLTCLTKYKKFNIEKAMTAEDRLGGHIVQGHVHGVGILKERKPVEGCNSVDFWFQVPSVGSDQQLKHKGSICIQGVSLTVAEIKDGLVRVSVIPHTREVTMFGELKVGDPVNIEFDQKKESKSEETPAPTDETFMRLAIEQGNKGRVTAPPNPWVGCVITKNNKVIGRGYHVKAGEPHAEINAIRDVAQPEEVEGSTAYVTLEPCSHHGRTGPCCEALVKARVARVVVAVRDPDEKVSGNGIKYLQDNGVDVTVGVCSEEAEKSLEAYLHQRRTGMPFVVVKIATTLDGFIACKDNTSQWITGPAARAEGHVIRSESQAIVVGSGTALADNPKLTVRNAEGVESDHQPVRVLLDKRGRVTSGHLFETSKAKTMVFTESDASAPHYESVEVCRGAFTLESVLKELGKRGVLQVMVEGGAEIHTSLMKLGLWNQLVLYQGPTFFGTGKKWLQDTMCDTIADAKFFKLDSCTALGDDVKLVYRNSKNL